MTNPFANQRILVWGAARSGLAACALLRDAASEVVLADDAPRGKIEAAVRSALGDLCFFGGGEFTRGVTGFDVLVVSPGVPLTHPRIAEAEAAGVPVLSELEVGSRFTEARLIAITGTNGKTTVATLTAHLLGGDTNHVYLAGNVGTALCEAVQRPEARSASATLVLEVSSFQCEHLDTFHPTVACVLNLKPDHLDRHGGMEGYRRAKAELGRNLTPLDTTVVNLDDQGALSVVRDWPGRHLGFSLNHHNREGVYLIDGTLTYSEDSRREPLLRRDDLHLPGQHNVSNALAAAAIARQCGVPPSDIAGRTRTFKGVPHRIELVATDRGVDYYNDSKATNLDSLTIALESFHRPVILIAGGRGKGEDYSAAGELIRARVKRLILIGEAAGLMQRAWGTLVPTQRATDLGQSIRLARAAAQPGDVVLLSPACASFDMFKDYEERGGQFREHVRALTGSGGANQ